MKEMIVSEKELNEELRTEEFSHNLFDCFLKYIKATLPER